VYSNIIWFAVLGSLPLKIGFNSISVGVYLDGIRVADYIRFVLLPFLDLAK